MAFIFFISLGFFIRKITGINSSLLKNLLFYFLLPIMIFYQLVSCPIKSIINYRFSFAYLLCFFLIFLASFFTFHKKKVGTLIVYTLNSGYVNSAFIGIPLLFFILNDSIAAILANLIQVILIMLPCIILLESIHENKKASLLKILLKTIISPIIFIPLLAIFLNFCQITFPQPYIFKLIAQATPYISLMYFGMSLELNSLKSIIRNPEVWKSVLLKNLIHPIFAYFVGNFLLSLPDYWLKSLIILSCCPTAQIVYLVSSKVKVSETHTKNVILLSSVVFLITLGLYIVINRLIL
tara:strand:+ start:13529 stop:14413 length:885 start_codon:yes stop_codon:yes gene_type:complete